MLTVCYRPANAATSDPPAAASSQGQQKATLIVKMAPGLSQAQKQAIFDRNGATLQRVIDKLNLHFIQVAAPAAAAIADNLKKEPGVVRVEVSANRKLQGLPNDAMVSSQWALPKIAWDQVYGANYPISLTSVAVLDTGVEATHPDLISALVPGTSFVDNSNGTTDENGHGTWLAGIVAARTDNLTGIAGVAYDKVQVMPVKVIGADGLGQDADIISGVVWAADNGASVILMAFSSPEFSSSLQDAIDYAWSKGVVLVAAAGNDGSTAPTFPAGDRGVMGVAATDQNDSLAPGSNSGASVFIAAPGVDILGTGLNGGYQAGNGTSGSAAIVAGAAALMHAVNPALSNGVIVSRLAANADPAGTQADTGNGRVQLARALADTSTDSIQPAGATPVGSGGPFVGPYKIAAVNIDIYDSSCTTATANFNLGATVCAKATGLGGGNTYHLEWFNPFNTLKRTSGNSTTGNFTDTYVPDSTGTWTVNVVTNATVVASKTFSVTGKQNQTITFGPLAGRVYGDADFTVSASASSGLPVSLSASGQCTVSGTTVHITAAGSCTITADQAGNATYNASPSVQQSFAIAKASAVCSVTGYSVTYDGGAHTATGSCTGVGGGPLIGLDLSGTTHTDAGTYTDTWDFTDTTGNYYNATNTVTDSVAQAPVTATAGSYSGTYDAAAHSPSTCTVTGSYTTGVSCANSPASVGPDVGSGPITPTVSGANTNFAVTSVNGSWNIAQASSTTTITCTAPVTYNGTAQRPCSAMATGAGGLSQPVTVNYTNNTNAGTANASANFAGDTNHIGSSASKTFTIDQAPVTITAGGGSGTYNGKTQTPSDCAVSGAYKGALTCSNNPSSVGPDANTYTIVPVLALNGETQGNFAVTPVNGSFTINPAPVTITAGGGSGTYNGAAQSPSACAVSGAYTGALACSNNPSSVGPDVGTTTIVPVLNLNGETEGNFAVTPVNGSYKINQAQVTATAGSGTATYNGTAQSPSACAVTGAYTTGVSCANNPASQTNAGTYTTSPSVTIIGSSANFAVTAVNGSFTIKPAPVTAHAGSYTGIYDGKSYSPVACKVVGPSVLSYVGDLTCSNSLSSVGPDVGTGTITPTNVTSPSGTDLNNFAIALKSGSWSITPAPLSITASSALGLPYGAPVPVILPSYNGFVNGETSAVLIGLTCGTTYVQYVSGIGAYTSTCTATSTNYSITSIPGTVTVVADLADCPVDQSTGLTNCYTGQKYAWTPTSTSNTASIQLSATIVDATPATLGDIRKATVTFGMGDPTTGNITPIPSATNLPVGLINPSDLTTGTASATVQFSLGANELCTGYHIYVLVGGSYKKAAPAWQNTMVSVCRATAGSIQSNPAAQIQNGGSAGILADTGTQQGTFTSVDFGVVYNKSKTNPQGRVQIQLLTDHSRTGQVDTARHTYEIDSNAITALSVNNNGTTATFQAKCNIYELVTAADGITQSSVVVDQGAMMTLTLDRSTQMLGITINASKGNGGMWFSSGWDGKQTINKPISNPGAITITP